MATPLPKDVIPKAPKNVQIRALAGPGQMGLIELTAPTRINLTADEADGLGLKLLGAAAGATFAAGMFTPSMVAKGQKGRIGVHVQSAVHDGQGRMGIVELRIERGRSVMVAEDAEGVGMQLLAAAAAARADAWMWMFLRAMVKFEEADVDAMVKAYSDGRQDFTALLSELDGEMARLRGDTDAEQTQEAEGATGGGEAGETTPTPAEGGKDAEAGGNVTT